MERQRHLTTCALLLAANCISHLAEVLKHNCQWRDIKHYLDYLSQFEEVRDLESITIEARGHMAVLGLKFLEDEDYIDAGDRVELAASVSTWQGRLEEMSKRWVLLCPQAHVELKRLVLGIKGFLDEEDLGVLEPLEEQGLNEATSCLLHNNFTSAEFIALRTVESLLRRWYGKRTGNKLERATWGEVLEELNNQFPKEKRPKELALLDYLRGRRNEIAHPEAISKTEEATATFLNVVAVCKSIKGELLEMRHEPSQDKR